VKILVHTYENFLNLTGRSYLLSGESKELGSTQNPTYAWKKSTISDIG
jgi:hypothetical protein